MDVVPPLTLLVTTGYLLMLFFNWQAGVGPDSEFSLGLFRSTPGNRSREFQSPIAPAGYTFGIWGVIYSGTGTWIIYVITTLFRTNAKGPVYLNPPTTSPAFLVLIMLEFTFNVTWLFCSDREVMILSQIAFLLQNICLYVAISISAARVYQYLFVFKEYGKLDLWLNRILIHNVLAIWATWVTVASKIGISTILIYVFGVDQETTVYVCLGFLASQLITYFILDCFVYDRYFRYILIVYPTAMWALGGILVNNIDKPTSPQAVLASTLFAIVFVFFVVKTILVIVRDPVYVIAKQKKADDVAYSRMV
eukprot:XP_011664454.1 PREDICTED: uncharacterized protein LOC100893870 isoform X1 [Strongylocentrotus purpuratus]